MFRKVIVGVDAREGDQDAISLAQALAPGAELVLVNAYPFDAVPSRFSLLGYGNALREDAEDAIRSVREAAQTPDARIELVGDSSPARALHRVAAAQHADLIVVGAAHRGPLGRVLLGDVSRGVLHGAPCPVAVAPRGRSATAPKRIGVAFDGSPEARIALEWAAAVAGALGSRLRITHAVLGPTAPVAAGTYGIDLHEIQEEMRNGAQVELDELVAGLDPALGATGEAVIGSSHDVLAALADEADLVVTGSRGWGTLRSVILGSTSDHLIHHAACPIAVVPRGAAEEAAADASGAEEQDALSS
jgi:nucleotide-binding universal stress UspA family protein